MNNFFSQCICCQFLSEQVLSAITPGCTCMSNVKTKIVHQCMTFKTEKKCPLLDGGSITWFEPPPIETTADINVVRTYSTLLREGSAIDELNKNFGLTQDFFFVTITIWH